MWDRRLYAWLTDDAEPRACKAIPEEACEAVPRSFLLNAANGASTKLAEELASPGVVLPWLLQSLAAPVVLVGWLEPLRQGGSLLPQLLVSAQIRRRSVRKWFWVGAGLTQAVALVVMASVAAVAEGLVAGLVLLAGLLVFSVASGVGSVAFSDVVGKTIPKGKRGQLLAVRATIGGALTLAVGIALRFRGDQDAGIALYIGLLLVAAALWALAALLFAFVAETPGASEGGRNAIGEIRKGGELVLRVSGFRRFLSARATLLAVEFAIPYYALHSRQLGLRAADLGVIIVAVGIANLVSSPVWGRLADRLSSRLVMVFGGLTSAAAGVLALALGATLGSGISAVAYAPVFVLAGLALSGVRLGRKTYLVDATEDSDRPLYVSMSNSLMGVVTFAYGGLGFLTRAVGVEGLLLILMTLSLLGAGAALVSPEADEMRGVPA